MVHSAWLPWSAQSSTNLTSVSARAGTASSSPNASGARRDNRDMAGLRWVFDGARMGGRLPRSKRLPVLECRSHDWVGCAAFMGRPSDAPSAILACRGRPYGSPGGPMDEDVVMVEIPVSREAAAALADADKRRRIGPVVSSIVRGP